jgi:hypothetical protein
VLSGRCLCDEPITRPEESYRLWCVVVCDLETSRIGAPYIYDVTNLRVNYALINITKVNRNNLIKFLLPTNVQENCFKRSIKIYIKTAPTCIGVITIIRERTI